MSSPTSSVSATSGNWFFRGQSSLKPAQELIGKKKIRVLLIEDDEADAYLVKNVLADNPRVKEVVIARDGVLALELINGGHVKPDLALIDLHLPLKDGFALLTHFAMRKQDWFPSVVLTSSRSKADAMRSMTRGAIGFVTKPLSIAKLKEALNREISRV